jgi:uncharacterized repeat protein (TIGR01451 family)
MKSIRGIRRRASRHSQSLVAIALVVVMLPLVLIFGAVSAGAATVTITSAGPLTSVGISDQLNCSVNHVDDAAGEFFGDTGCGTFIVVDGTMFYSPSVIPAGSAATSTTPFTPVSQTGPTGAGTEDNPYKIVTVVDAGATGVRLTQTDSYVTGLESYRTDIVVSNTSGASKTARVYRAADCYLQSSDSGYGAVDTDTGAVACTTGLETGSRIEQWFPLTAGSRYIEAGYSTVWSTIGQMLPFPNTCTCATLNDNGAGLSWDKTVPAGSSTTISSLITFSPLGHLPLALSKTADAGTVAAGATTGYTVTVDNPNAAAVALDSLTDTLPAGFTYVQNSTTGATTANPTIVGQELTWSGISATGGGASTSLHFSVTASSVPGAYTNQVTATAEAYTIAPTGPTASITVTGTSSPLVIALTPETATNPVGTSHTVTATVTRNAVAQSGVPVSFQVLTGPNSGTSGTVQTNASGVAAFSYTGGATPGTDSIRASAIDEETSVFSNTVTKTWTAASSPLVLALTPATATNPVGTNHTVTVHATRNGVAQNEVNVSFAVTSGPNAGSEGSGSTNASGDATFTYSSAVAGTDTIQASAFDGETAVTSNSVTKTWTAVTPGGLTIASVTEPSVVTVGTRAQTTVTATNTGTTPLTGVSVTLTRQAGTTFNSVTPSQGTCAAPVGLSVTCTLGTLVGGAAATVKLVFTAPGAVPAGGTVTTNATGTSTQTGPVAPAPSNATVQARIPGQAHGFVSPGGTLSTGTTATPQDNTIISFTLPNSGPGAPIDLLAESSPLTFCGGQACSGKTAFVSPFVGYDNPNAPAKVKITWDKTVAGRGIFSKLYVQKAPDGPIVQVPECAPRPRYDSRHREIRGWFSWFIWWLLHLRSGFGPHSGIANPSPCVDARSVDRHGDVTFEILLLSGDPKFGRR